MASTTTTFGSVQNPPLITNWPVNIAVVVTRLLVAGGIWASVIAMFDDPRVTAPDARVVNLRLGLWLFIVELLFDAYRTAYATPKGFRGTIRLAVKESFSAGLMALWIAPLSLLARGTVIVLATWLLLMVGGPAWLPYLAAFLPTIATPLLRRWMRSRFKIPDNGHIRGTHLGSYAEAVAKAAMLTDWNQDNVARKLLAATQADRPFLQIWADRVTSVVRWGVDLPLSIMDPHYLFLGVAGTGKTLLMRLLMRSVLVREERLMARAIVYDAKRSFYPLLVGMGIPPAAIVIMNSADVRAAAWDIAADIQTKDHAHTIAINLVPQPEGDGREQVFFAQAVQAIITAVMWLLHRRSPGCWQLMDVLRAVATPDTLKAFFIGDTEGMATYSRYFNEATEMGGGIIATLDTKVITAFETVARVWERSDQRVSLRKWANDPIPKILMLGNDEDSAAITHINQAMFGRVVQLVTAKKEDSRDPDHHLDPTWFFLDELRFAKELPLLGELISLGRSKGARVVMATQDIDGLYATYGQHKAEELLSLCGNVAVFRLMSPKTREWAAKFFGEYEAWEEDYSQSSTSSGIWPFNNVSKTKGTSHKRVKKESILPSEFFDLPKAGPDHGLGGHFATPEMGAWRGPIPWDYVRQHLSDADEGTPGFMARPPQDYAALPEPSPAPAPVTNPNPARPGGPPAANPTPPAPPPAGPAQTPPNPPPAKKRPGRLPW